MSDSTYQIPTYIVTKTEDPDIYLATTLDGRAFYYYTVYNNTRYVTPLFHHNNEEVEEKKLRAFNSLKEEICTRKQETSEKANLEKI